MKKIVSMVLAAVLLTACFVFTASAAAFGDVDGDGKTSAADARLALRAAVSLEHYSRTSAAFLAADANGDGEITAEDARLILRASVGLGNIIAALQDNASEWSSYSDKTMLGAYAAQVQTLKNKCGEGRVSSSMKSLDGLSVVRLIDLDEDGKPELYCAYADSRSAGFSNRQAVYVYSGGKLISLFDGDITNMGSDYSPCVWFQEGNNCVYFVAGMIFYRSFFKYENGAFKETVFSTDYVDYAKINGRTVTMDQYNAQIKTYTGGLRARINIYDYTETADANYRAVLNETARVISLLNK